MRIIGRCLSWSLLAVAALAIAACGGGDTDATPTTGDGNGNGDGAAISLDSITIGTGSSGGAYDVVGQGLGQRLQEEFGISVTATITEGSGENIRLLDQEEIEVGMIASNGLYPAWEGSQPFERAYEDMRLLGYLWVHPTLWIALQESGYTAIGDLQGERVGVGPGPTTWDHIARPMLEAHGLDYENGIETVYAGFGSLADQVRDGQIAASIGVSTIPAFQELAASRDVTYLTWDPEAVDQIAEEVPFFTRMTLTPEQLPEGNFEGDEYLTVDLGGPFLVVRPEMSEEDAYQITKAIYGNIDALAQNIGQLDDVAGDSKDVALTRAGDIPFHPGAIRYWEEAGLWEE